MKYLTVVCSLAVLLLGGFPAVGRSDEVSIELRFENRQFAPQRMSVPANQPLRIRVTNASTEPIEFESFKLNREKVISPGQTITVFLPALGPGSYDFYDDFHEDVPEGALVAK